MKPVPKLGRRRFSAVQLLIALALLFFFFPFVEEVKGGDIIVSLLLSLVLICAVLAVANSGRTLVIAVLLVIPAVVGRWISHFWPRSGSACRLPYRRTGRGCFRRRESAAIYPARAFGNHRSALCEHFGLSAGRSYVDDGLLACGPINAAGSVLFQHERGKPDPWTASMPSTSASSH